MLRKIDQSVFYNEYHGHPISELEVLHSFLRQKNDSIIWLAGDSSLDNKFWFPETAKSVNGYESVIVPPKSKKDIAYWMNKQLALKLVKYAVINCSIEESSVGDRSFGRLLPQDKYIRDNIQSNDMLVVSMGGNDIALKPNLATILNLLSLVYCTHTSCIRDCSCGTALPCDDYCCGCGCGCLSNLLAFPCGFGYFIHLFKTRIEAVIDRITSKTRPKYIFVCMIYYLDANPGKGWAETALSIMQYNSNPSKVQHLIKNLFEKAISKISIPGSTVVGIPLFEVLNGKISTDYVQRVEPSAKGGEKMGKFIIDYILKANAVIVTNMEESEDMDRDSL